MPVPNIDALTDSELYDFVVKHKGGMNYKTLFGSIFPGVLGITNDLSHYATCVLGERVCRKRGDIPQSLVYQNMKKDILNSLPARAKWAKK